MNYELAKQLKDAGFPQREGRWICEHNDVIILKGACESYYYPTLEELIEACGDEFHCLILTTTGGIDSNKKFWSAGYNDKVVDWQNGVTPSEAVAKLWLALNKK